MRLSRFQPLRDRTARQGDRVLLECAVTPSFPPPEKVQWYRNEIEIFSSPDYTISFSVGGMCTLVIAEAFPEDSGLYTCTVTVNGLTNSSTMQLIIEGQTRAIVPSILFSLYHLSVDRSEFDSCMKIKECEELKARTFSCHQLIACVYIGQFTAQLQSQS